MFKNKHNYTNVLAKLAFFVVLIGYCHFAFADDGDPMSKMKTLLDLINDLVDQYLMRTLSGCILAAGAYKCIETRSMQPAVFSGGAVGLIKVISYVMRS